VGSRDGLVVRAVASHQCSLGLILPQCHVWVEFVVGGFYSGLSGFPPFTKTNIFKFQFNQPDRRHALKPAKADVACS